MSAHKVKRLRTPGRDRDSPKHMDSTLLTRLTSNEESPANLSKNTSNMDPVHMALMAEINNVYQQITTVRSQSKKYQQLALKFEKQKQQLQAQVGKLSQDIASYQELYQLQILNHHQLRKFYEQRELQWRNIVEQHRLLLEEYDRQNQTNYSKLEQIPQASSRFTEQLSQSVQNIDLESSMKRQSSKSIRRRSLQSKNKSLPRLKLSRESSKIDEYYREMSKLYTRESKFALKVQNQYTNMQKEHTKLKSTSKIVEADEFFDRVVRVTYYKFKDQCVTVNEIVNMEDMKKLKNANTSTRQRLIKTLRKLRFQLNNQEQIKDFCEYVEKAVLKKYKTFRGDYAFQMLVDKLEECEKLAISSNSELQRFEKEKSYVKDEPISLKFSRTHKDISLLRSSKSASELDKVSSKNLQLLLNSSIKQESRVRKTIYEEQPLNQSINSESSIKFGSRLPIQSFSRSQHGSNYFQFGYQSTNPENEVI